MIHTIEVGLTTELLLDTTNLLTDICDLLICLLFTSQTAASTKNPQFRMRFHWRMNRKNDVQWIFSLVSLTWISNNASQPNKLQMTIVQLFFVPLSEWSVLCQVTIHFYKIFFNTADFQGHYQLIAVSLANWGNFFQSRLHPKVHNINSSEWSIKLYLIIWAVIWPVIMSILKLRTVLYYNHLIKFHRLHPNYMQYEIQWVSVLSVSRV